MFKICRHKYKLESCSEEPKVTERSILLEKWSDEYYQQNHPNIVRNIIIFMQMGNEFIWTFKEAGDYETFFPLDRLPKYLEDYLAEKSKNILDDTEK